MKSGRVREPGMARKGATTFLYTYRRKLMDAQTKWDCFLITSFFKRGDMRMNHITAIYNRSIEGLLRTPVENFQRFSTVRVFVCQALPKLGELLWTKTIEDAYDIAVTLPDSLVTKHKVYSKFSRKERNERQVDMRHNEADHIADWAYHDYKDKNSAPTGRGGIGRLK